MNLKKFIGELFSPDEIVHFRLIGNGLKPKIFFKKAKDFKGISKIIANLYEKRLQYDLRKYYS